MNRIRIAVLWAAFMFSIAAVPVVTAQDPFDINAPADDVFGDDIFDDDPADMPLPEAPPVEGEAAEGEAGGAVPPPTDSPAVRAIRMRRPQSADELLLAIDQLIRLGRFDVARQYLDQLNNLNLDDVDLTRLQQRFGTGPLLRLMRTPELAPQGQTFATSALEAARRVSLDPQRLRAWADQLGSESRTISLGVISDIESVKPPAFRWLILDWCKHRYRRRCRG